MEIMNDYISGVLVSKWPTFLINYFLLVTTTGLTFFILSGYGPSTGVA